MPPPICRPPGNAAKRGAGRVLVAGPEHDDVPASQAVAAVKFGEPGGWDVRRRNSSATRPVVVERSADNLLHLAFMQINAGTEHHLNIMCLGVGVEGENWGWCGISGVLP